MKQDQYFKIFIEKFAELNFKAIFEEKIKLI